ncbi:dispanin subfamily A member 2b-like [Sebastes umbrosus]|uniref:dispanin subfamily A member 2b-like n=1 Tax=Sebastes umbrosus TaxID=72105 RepID=UPI00189D3151|nr:dispanin subfamily A member 2b-like isoform X1 [Sebastes umbrosus]XP_037622734.1 dispanin subfamily A member 2b-like isoform X2 [Sebastes umbrosus]XP_037622735.1 dispanin subfamily A member 2b-like [Sebastes umbrosus]
MNPAGYPIENVPLQGTYDGQHGGPTTVQYTTLNIETEPPKDHIIWSLLCFMYSNPCCLGLAALIFSIKARDRKVAGDLEGARHYGSTARCLNIVATVLVSTVVLIAIITITAVLVQMNEVYRSYSGYHTYNYDYNHRG